MKTTIGAALFFLLLCWGKAAAAPVFLHFEAIEGEVKTDGYEDWIDVQSFNFALDRDSGGVGMSEFAVVKRVDKSSPLLFLEAAAGGTIPVVLIDFFRNSPSEPRYIRVRLTDVIVSGYELEQGRDSLEKVWLNFERIKLEQTEFGNDGQPTHTTRVYYDLSKGEGGALPDGPPPGENTPPSITAIADQTIPWNTAADVAFTIDDLETSPDFLVLSAESSNTDLVPVSNIVFGGSGNNRNATVTPVAGAFGSSLISLTVSDGMLSSTSQFTLTVEPDEGPSIGDIADVATGQNQQVSVPFTIAHPTADLDSLLLSAESTDEEVLPIGNIAFGGSGANRTAELIPATDATGASTVTITVDDGSHTASTSFLFTVMEAPPPPSITSPDRVAGVAGHPLAIDGILISDPLTGHLDTLVFSTSNGTLTLATDVPGGLGAGQVQGNGTSAITVSATAETINTTLAATGSLIYFSNTSGEGALSLELTRNGSIAAAAIVLYLHAERIDLWRTLYFSEEDLSDPEKEATLWGDLANPTGDGKVNFLKYATGLSPLEPHASSSLPGSFLFEEDGQQYLAFTIVRRNDDPTLEYAPEASSDLAGWEKGGAAFQEHAVTPIGDGLEQVVYRHPLSADGPAGRFVRLRVTRLPGTTD